MNIKCFKLASGEEVIGKIDKEDDQSVTLKSVASIIIMPGQVPGSYGLGLMPYLPYADAKDFTFSKRHVMVSFDPNTDMINNYNAKFGSGLQLVKGSI